MEVIREDMIDMIDMIGTWAELRKEDIHKIYEQKGGWEGWMQVELALYLASNYPHINVRREENVYSNNPKLRADILFKKRMGWEIVELKCESLFQDLEGFTRFASTFKNDLIKVHDAQLKPEYRTISARIWCVGITCDPRVSDATRGFHWEPYNVQEKELSSNLHIWFGWRDVHY